MGQSPAKSETSGTAAANGVAWRVGQLLLSHASGAGRVSLVALDPARDHFGPEWPRVVDKVRGIVEEIFRKSIRSGECYCPIDSLSYLIIFDGDEGDIAGLLDEASTEIAHKIMGGPTRKVFITSTILTVCSADQLRSSDRKQPGAALSAAPRSSHIERLLTEAAQNEEKFSFDSIKHAHSPICSMDQLSISASMCRPLRSGARGRIRYGYDVLPADAELPLIAELDALTADYAAKLLANPEDGKAQSVVYIPIHRLTLSSRKYRDIYLKICQGLLLHYKENVIFDIYGIEDGTPPNRIFEYMQWLRPHARAIAATVNIDFTTMASFAGSNVHSIGIDLASCERDNFVPKIAAFVSRVKSINMKCHVHGVNAKPVANLCLSLATDAIDCDYGVEV